MSVYLEEYKFFAQNSKRKILDIEIRQFLYRSLYMELHLMEDDSYALFYNFALRTDDLIRNMSLFIRENKEYKDCSFDDILKNQEFIKILRKQEPIKTQSLSNCDIEKINNLLKEFPLKKLVNIYNSDSSYIFTANIYENDEKQNYRCWCEIPKEWDKLKEIINICLEYIKSVNGEYHPR